MHYLQYYCINTVINPRTTACFLCSIGCDNNCKLWTDKVLERKGWLCPILMYKVQATRYGVDGPGIESLWGRDFPHPSSRPRGPPSLLYNGYWVSFPGVKRPGRGANHASSSRAEVKERVELCLYSPSGSSWRALGWNLRFTIFYLTTVICHFLQPFRRGCGSSAEWIG